MRLAVLPGDDDQDLAEARPPVGQQLAEVDGEPLLPRVKRCAEHDRSEMDDGEAVASLRRQLP
jgi:hypothetical protein